MALHASWRTRHLRIRAAILREAIEDTDAACAGLWRLLHLKGSELVADGLTKQLNGQAFFKFVEDLGIKRSTSMKLEVPQMDHGKGQSGGGDGHRAMKAIMVGSSLVASAKAMDEEDAEKDEYDTNLCDWRGLDGARGSLCWAVDARSFSMLLEKTAGSWRWRSTNGSGSCEQIGSGPMPTSSLKVESRLGTGGASSLTLPSRSGSRAMISGTTSENMTSQSGRSSGSPMTRRLAPLP